MQENTRPTSVSNESRDQKKPFKGIGKNHEKAQSEVKYDDKPVVEPEKLETKQEIQPEATPDLQLTQRLPMFQEYILELINNNYSRETVDNYKRDLGIFASFLDFEKISFADVDKLKISKYKEYLRSGKYLEYLLELRRKSALTPGKARRISENKKSSPEASKRVSMYSGRLGSRSVNRMLSALRSYLKFLIDIDYKNLPLPPDAIKMIKTERKETQVAEFSELVKLIEAPEVFETKKLVKIRNRAMLELLFSTGMRISELTNLNREDLKISGSGNITEAKIYIMGKGKKQRFVYLTPRCITYLERYLYTRSDKFPALFIPYRGLHAGTGNPYVVRVSTNYWQYKIKEYRVRLGIIVPTSAHSLRHGFATYLAEKGASASAIQKLLGHESLQTTSKYLHASDRFAENVHEKYHPLKK